MDQLKMVKFNESFKVVDLRDAEALQPPLVLYDRREKRRVWSR
jgi:uncharacterized protein YqkB